MDEHSLQKQLDSKQHCSEQQLNTEKVQSEISCTKPSVNFVGGRDSVNKKVLWFPCANVPSFFMFSLIAYRFRIGRVFTLTYSMHGVRVANKW
jgi:hypothetical protein